MTDQEATPCVFGAQALNTESRHNASNRNSPESQGLFGSSLICLDFHEADTLAT